MSMRSLLTAGLFIGGLMAGTAGAQGAPGMSPPGRAGGPGHVSARPRRTRHDRVRRDASPPPDAPTPHHAARAADAPAQHHASRQSEREESRPPRLPAEPGRPHERPALLRPGRSSAPGAYAFDLPA